MYVYLYTYPVAPCSSDSVAGSQYPSQPLGDRQRVHATHMTKTKPKVHLRDLRVPCHLLRQSCRRGSGCPAQAEEQGISGLLNQVGPIGTLWCGPLQILSQARTPQSMPKSWSGIGRYYNPACRRCCNPGWGDSAIRDSTTLQSAVGHH